MFIKTIAVGYSRKFNLGDFNSAELSVNVWASLSEGEDEDVCTSILQDKCREAVRNEYLKLIKKQPPAEVFKVNGDEVPEFVPEGEIQ